MSTTELDPRPARALTSREIAKMIMGLLGGLAQFCEIGEMRRAVSWISETEDAWKALEASQPVGEELAEKILSQIRGGKDSA